mmetsp:Transcript_46853/g.123475  ORF Transcript_46853/g.123475 Transcript_46853/m.123475 type:complete len:137 (-) Transcript_46853:261-671(-)
MLTPARLAALPSLQMIFGERPATPLLIRPHQYMVEFPRRNGARGVFADPSKRNYCVAIFDNHGGGTVIGASIMRHREVVFDVRQATITFADADCSTMSARSSHLQRPFKFASCDPSSNSSAAAQSPLTAFKSLLSG